MRESFIKASEEFTKGLTEFEDVLDRHKEVQEDYLNKKKSYYDKVQEYKSKKNEFVLENMKTRDNKASLKLKCEKLENELKFTESQEVNNQIEELDKILNANNRSKEVIGNILSNGNQELISLANEYYQITHKYITVAGSSCNDYVSALDNIIKIAQSEKERLRYEFLEPLRRDIEEARKETENKPSYIQGGK